MTDTIDHDAVVELAEMYAKGDHPGPYTAISHIGDIARAYLDLRAKLERAERNLKSRDDFLSAKGLFMEYADTLPKPPGDQHE